MVGGKGKASTLNCGKEVVWTNVLQLNFLVFSSEARVVGLYRWSHVVKIKQMFPSWLQL